MIKLGKVSEATQSDKSAPFSEGSDLPEFFI
jgi:hypothetical protein